MPGYLPAYTEENRIVLSVRPGITDPASIAFRDEERLLAEHLDVERAYVELLLPRKLTLAREYIRQQGLVKDIQILMTTAAVLLAPSQECQRR